MSNVREAERVSKLLNGDLQTMVGSIASDLLKEVVAECPVDTGTLQANFAITNSTRPLTQLSKSTANARQRASHRLAKKANLRKPLRIVNPTRYFPFVSAENDFVERAVRKVR